LSQTSAPQRRESCGAWLNAVGLPAQLLSSQPAPHALLEPLVRGHQRLGHEASAKRAVAAALVRKITRDELCQQLLALGGREFGGH